MQIYENASDECSGYSSCTSSLTIKTNYQYFYNMVVYQNSGGDELRFNNFTTGIIQNSIFYDNENYLHIDNSDFFITNTILYKN